jgi:hypothetical protein
MNALRDRHIQIWILILFLIVGTFIGLLLGPYFFKDDIVYDYTVTLKTPEGKHIDLQHGIWPELSNAEFSAEVRSQFIQEKVNFIEANVSSMQLTVYKEGLAIFSTPIKSKGREGSWWETPSGLYSAQTKKQEHFSSFGHVYMPYSIQFQGNFFIHGWPFYPDGTPVAEGYSGGCIRLEDANAKQVFELTEIGMPILVYEEAPQNMQFTYTLKAPEISSKSYLVADIDNNFLLMASNHQKIIKTDLIARLMVAVVATEYLNIEKQITITSKSIAGIQENQFEIGRTYRLYDLLYPLLQEGSIEAGQTITTFFGEKYIQKHMQNKALALGMKNTTFGLVNNGSWGQNTTTAEDVFLFLKYIASNRHFLLRLSTNNPDNRIYGDSVFSNLQLQHPLGNNVYFRGGASDEKMYPTISDVDANSNLTSTVSLVFASSTVRTTSDGYDSITLMELPFNHQKRTVIFITFDSLKASKDTEEMMRYVEKMYQ